ncbi:MAG: NADH-quinone oxidoreductase subunit NuoH [Candidatus Eremiobacteraeota bacterium]|nr:NADH-quinone oxidoreductase subunit NuoH [Candidatus Eremiobacteraeota bacterium]
MNFEYYLWKLADLIAGPFIHTQAPRDGWVGLILHVIFMAIVVLIILTFLALDAFFLIWLERKISARIQNRVGPMVAGPRFLARLSMWTGGIFQTLWDTIKLMLKEDIINRRADRLGFKLAPFICMAATFMAFLVIPFSRGLIAQDLNIGILYIIAISSLAVISILTAGWSSGNKYSLLGGLRSAAQIISYEVPMIFGILGPVMIVGSLSLVQIVEAQKTMGWFFIPQILAFLVYFISATAEINRTPFDLPEAESELVAGFVTEYTGMRFAMFFLAEFTNMFIISAIAVSLFFGGWLLPFGLEFPKVFQIGNFVIPYVDVFLGAVIFFIKTYFFVIVLMWFRWTFPRVRVDHLLNLGWKVLLPVGFINMLITGFFILRSRGG